MGGKLILTISVLNLFAIAIAIGPSRLHTVGPMRAVAQFMTLLAGNPIAALVAQVRGLDEVMLPGTEAGPAFLSFDPTPDIIFRVVGRCRHTPTVCALWRSIVRGTPC